MQLTQAQLYAIEIYLQEGYKDAKIARKIGKSKSVVSRLFQKHPKDSFSAERVVSERFSTRSENTTNHTRIQLGGELESFILAKLKKHHSPEQIAGSWRKETGEKVCKDSIYSFVYEHYPELVKKYFRRKGKKYRNRVQDRVNAKYQLQDRTMIDRRPKVVEKRSRIGDWEGDTIIGKDHKGAILTLLERKTGYFLAYKLEQGKKAEGVTSILERCWKQLPERKRKTLTVDNGREFADHLMITYFTKTPVFFCNTYCSWQKGSVENANGLLREYIPKKADFNTISQEMLDEIVKQINLRPRKRLNYFTPFEMFWEKSCISE